MSQNNFIVLTGGPGAGKTTIIQALEMRGYSCAEETGRKVIKEQIDQKGSALPWENQESFRDLMLKQEITSYKLHQNDSGLVFFDRGIIDVLGYSQLEKLGISDELMESCKHFRYNPSVFIFPPWETIFTCDSERKQDFATAVATHRAMVKAYAHYGYNPIEVPKCSEGERVEFILANVPRSTTS